MPAATPPHPGTEPRRVVELPLLNPTRDRPCPLVAGRLHPRVVGRNRGPRRPSRSRQRAVREVVQRMGVGFETCSSHWEPGPARPGPYPPEVSGEHPRPRQPGSSSDSLGQRSALAATRYPSPSVPCFKKRPGMGVVPEVFSAAATFKASIASRFGSQQKAPLEGGA